MKQLTFLTEGPYVLSRAPIFQNIGARLAPKPWSVIFTLTSMAFEPRALNR